MQFTPKIIVIDDVQMIRRALKTTLLKAGVTGIEEAKNGAEAIERLKEQQFDLIICDWEMPLVTGLETLRFVRKDEKHKDTPFIMVTSVADPEKIRQAMTVGVTDYIVKPVKPDLFLGKVMFILQKIKAEKMKNYDPTEVKEWKIS
ncbi:MAG: response regulator [Gammaproteobacteria bacterium]|nr:response regulator [Gammaproteobacteria bacterium]